MLNWKILGSGAYNTVYRSNDGKLVLKIQKRLGSLSDRYDSPERSVRLWNLINPSLEPKATIVNTELGRGWICPYVDGEKPTDEELSHALITIFNQTGRVVVDAMSKKNFIKTNSGELVCVDVGMALLITSNRSNQRAISKKRKYSIISNEAWNKEKNGLAPFFTMFSQQYPLSIATIKTLIYVSWKDSETSNTNLLVANHTELLNIANKYDQVLQQQSPTTLEHTKQYCINQLKNYIASRGSISINGRFEPSFITWVFRDSRLTAFKIKSAQKLMRAIREASSLSDIKDLITQDFQIKKLKKARLSSDYIVTIGKCNDMVDSIVAPEDNSFLVENG
ncbi:MAG: hypothetical protein ACOVQX_05210 [Legionella sp.]